MAYTGDNSYLTIYTIVIIVIDLVLAFCWSNVYIAYRHISVSSFEVFSIKYLFKVYFFSLYNILYVFQTRFVNFTLTLKSGKYFKLRLMAYLCIVYVKCIKC